jgi:hypothetical protein
MADPEQSHVPRVDDLRVNGIANSSLDDLPGTLLPRRLIEVVALHQVTAQTNILRKTAPA